MRATSEPSGGFTDGPSIRKPGLIPASGSPPKVARIVSEAKSLWAWIPLQRSELPITQR